MKLIDVELTGVSAYLQHRFSEESLFGLLAPKTKKKVVEEVKTPREIAEKHAYKGKDGTFYIPLEQVSGAFAYAASDYKLSSTSRKSLKTVAKGIFRPASETATILDLDNRPVADFETDVRRAVNHKSGAVAVCRPRFDQWKVRFQVELDDSILPEKTALEILNDAGKRSGIGSFRVSKNGFFGQFAVTSWKESKRPN